MTRATFAKLAILIFLAFIMCLPEFFPSETVVHFHFLCSPFDPCDPLNALNPYEGQVYEVYYNASRTTPLCGAEPENATSQDWFVCETGAALQSLRVNASVSGLAAEITLTLQTKRPHLQNVTLQGHFDDTGLHIRTQANITLLRCCTNYAQRVNAPGSDLLKSNTSNSEFHSTIAAPRQDFPSNTSLWLLHFPDLPRVPVNAAMWWSSSAIVWFVLILVVILVVLISVMLQVRYYQKRPAVEIPASVYQATFSKRRVKSLGDLPDATLMFTTTEDKDLFSEGITSSHSTRLSPIHEVSTTDVTLEEDEDRLDDILTEDGSEESMHISPISALSETFTFLHHRGNPSTAVTHQGDF